MTIQDVHDILTWAVTHGGISAGPTDPDTIGHKYGEYEAYCSASMIPGQTYGISGYGDTLPEALLNLRELLKEHTENQKPSQEKT